MLDSRLSGFFEECKKKSEKLIQEINALKAENIELEKLVKTNEVDAQAIEIKQNKVQVQYEQVKNLNRSHSYNYETTKERLTKASNDFCNITKAHQHQRANISKAENNFNDREEGLANEKRERIKMNKERHRMMDEKIDRLKMEISAKEQLNGNMRMELLERELKDSYRVSNIMDQRRKYAAKA